MKPCFAVSAVLAGSAIAAGAVYTVPLPGALGTYPPSPHHFSFDLGTALTSVQSVKVEWEGSMMAGYDSTPIGGGLLLVLSPLNARAVSPKVGTSTWPQPESFSSLTNMTLYSGKNWDFLLDGRADGYVEIDYIIGGPSLVQPSGQLSIANLIIEATPVPEPTVLVLFAVGGLMWARFSTPVRNVAGTRQVTHSTARRSNSATRRLPAA